MEPDFETRLMLAVFAGVAAVWVVRLGIAIPKLGIFMLVFVWALGCAFVTTRWDLAVGWVIAGSMGAVILLVCVVFLALWLHDWWHRQS